MRSGGLIEHTVPASDFSVRRKWAGDKGMTAVGERDRMSELRQQFGLPQCTSLDWNTLRQCTRAAGHDEMRETQHVHASPTWIVMAVWKR